MRPARESTKLRSIHALKFASISALTRLMSRLVPLFSLISASISMTEKIIPFPNHKINEILMRNNSNRGLVTPRGGFMPVGMGATGTELG